MEQSLRKLTSKTESEKKQHAKQVHKFYFDHPEIWDKVRNHSIEREVAFIDFFLRRYSVKKVLYVGCGTGIHCAKLSELGYETTGVDKNNNMIKYARKQRLKGSFLLGDMRRLSDLDLKTKFGAILCLCTTFTYNITNEEIAAVLRDFNRLLKANGLLIIEIFNPIGFLQKNVFDGSFFMEDKMLFESIGLNIEISHTVDERKQTMFEVKKTRDLANHLLKVDNVEYRLLFPQELVYFLKTAGFAVLEQYGKYDLNYKSLDRTRMITVSSKIRGLK